MQLNDNDPPNHQSSHQQDCQDDDCSEIDVEGGSARLNDGKNDECEDIICDDGPRSRRSGPRRRRRRRTMTLLIALTAVAASVAVLLLRRRGEEALVAQRAAVAARAEATASRASAVGRTLADRSRGAWVEARTGFVSLLNGEPPAAAYVEAAVRGLPSSVAGALTQFKGTAAFLLRFVEEKGWRAVRDGLFEALFSDDGGDDGGGGGTVDERGGAGAIATALKRGGTGGQLRHQSTGDEQDDPPSRERRDTVRSPDGSASLQLGGGGEGGAGFAQPLPVVAILLSALTTLSGLAFLVAAYVSRYRRSTEEEGEEIVATITPLKRDVPFEFDAIKKGEEGGGGEELLELERSDRHDAVGSDPQHKPCGASTTAVRCSSASTSLDAVVSAPDHPGGEKNLTDGAFTVAAVGSFDILIRDGSSDPTNVAAQLISPIESPRPLNISNKPRPVTLEAVAPLAVIARDPFSQNDTDVRSLHAEGSDNQDEDCCSNLALFLPNPPPPASRVEIVSRSGIDENTMANTISSANSGTRVAQGTSADEGEKRAIPSSAKMSASVHSRHEQHSPICTIGGTSLRRRAFRQRCDKDRCLWDVASRSQPQPLNVSRCYERAVFLACCVVGFAVVVIVAFSCDELNPWYLFERHPSDEL